MFVNWTGCATSGKTFAASLFAIIWWMSDMNRSTVVLTSTTGKMIKRRIWPNIQEFYHTIRESLGASLKIDPSKVEFGNLVDSQTTLQASRGDDLHAIFAKPVLEGKTSKAAADIQGLHPKRMFVIVDEATDTPEAILAVVPNLRKIEEELIVLTIGNANSRLDVHGRMCEPVGGYHSISKDDEWWETKGVPEWQVDPGVSLHFQGSKSPNVKAGKTIYPFIYKYEDYQNALAKRGAESLWFWKMDEGFWPPDGFCNTVFTETMVDKFDLRGRHVFLRNVIPIAGLDPGFGGDPGVLFLGLLGELPGGLMAIQIEEEIPIILKATSKDEYETQIAKQVIEACGKGIGNYGPVRADCFGADATGIGRGAYAVMKEKWPDGGGGIHRVEFGGLPSERPATKEDPRPCSEVYDRQVTELCYSCKEFAIGGQLKGLNRETIVEFCSREYEIKNRKYSIETKDKFKERYGSSPNRADAIKVLVEVARRKGALARGYSTGEEVGKTKVAQIAKINEVYANVDYSAPEEPEYDSEWEEVG